MKPPHELEREWWWLSRWALMLWGDIIRNVLVGLLLGRLGKMILGRVGSSAPCGDIWPMRVRDDSWAAVLRSPKCHASLVMDGGRIDALERLGLYEAVPGAKVCQHFEGEKCMWRLRSCSSFSSRNSSVYRPRAPLNSGMLSERINSPRRNWTVPRSSYLVITV
ncbi:hypothetical protein GOBAR_AA18491 [Gossypium barbadense]|uniref:Uncharacterized protein n=1 Tax=Gossypium barbadense TaxID=3634 RepID=A0A2P5XFP8_GOSBA|nr:hypothetical protein GOBAR_AA18491 [Gossypium barbadense]